MYDPRESLSIQSLSAGVELLEQIDYTISDQNGGTAEATLFINVMGVNDAPSTSTDNFSTDEDSLLKIDAVDLLANDSDQDSDDDASTLKIVGLSSPSEVKAYQSAKNGDAIDIFTADEHLSTGVEKILISGHAGSPPLNGVYGVEIVNSTTFRIDKEFDDTSFENGVSGYWSAIDESNDEFTLSDKGLGVQLEIRADDSLFFTGISTNIVYDLDGNDFFDSMPFGSKKEDGFWYLAKDSHSDYGLGRVEIEINGVNDQPIANHDPIILESFLPMIGTELKDLKRELVDNLAVNYVSEDESGFFASLSFGENNDPKIYQDAQFTDQLSDLEIHDAFLLENDIDVDEGSILSVSVAGQSVRGASLSKQGEKIVYSPANSEELSKLSKGELCVDIFSVVISDEFGDSMSSLVAVIVEGVNEAPVAASDLFDSAVEGNQNYSVKGILDNDTDNDVNNVNSDDELYLLDKVKTTTDSGVSYAIEENQMIIDFSVSKEIEGLAEGVTSDQSFVYEVSDGSLVFAVDDFFSVAPDSIGVRLNVLANDQNFYDSPSEDGNASSVEIVSVSSPDKGGSVTIVSDNEGQPFLIYDAPNSYVGYEYFEYTIMAKNGRLESGKVKVSLLVDQINGYLNANDDYFTVASGLSLNNSPLLDVLANDLIISANAFDQVANQQLKITEVTQSNDLGAGQVSIVENKIVMCQTKLVCMLFHTQSVPEALIPMER